MIQTTAELLRIYGSHYGIAKAVSDGELIKVAHGLYSDSSPETSELETICARYPNAVLTMESAFAFYHLSDYVPDRYYMATLLNAHRIQHEKVIQCFMSNELVPIGVTEIMTKNGIIRVYDRERMLIELFRFKNRIPPDYFREVVNSYRELAKEESIDFRKLASYCRQFKKGSLIKARIEEVVL